MKYLDGNISELLLLEEHRQQIYSFLVFDD